MGVVLGVWVVALAAPVGTVTALPGMQASPPERVELPVVARGCAPAAESPSDVVVCGKGEARHRIDPVTLRVLRSREAGPTDQRLGRERMFADACNPYGPMASCGGGAVPLLPGALKAIRIAVKAIKGEDLRPELRVVPTEYELHQQAEAERLAAAEGE